MSTLTVESMKMLWSYLLMDPTNVCPVHQSLVSSFTARLSTPCDCILSHFGPSHPSRSLTLRSFPELSLSVTIPIQCNQPVKPFTPTVCTRAITANPPPAPLEVLSLGSPTASSPAAKPHHPLTSFCHSLTHHFPNWLHFKDYLTHICTYCSPRDHSDLTHGNVFFNF